MILFRKASFWLAILGIAAVAIMVHRTTKMTPMPGPVYEPAAKPAARAISAAGLVESLGENTGLGVPVAGLVAAVPVKAWDQVQAGTPVLRLDDRELRAQLRSQHAELLVQETQLASDRRQAERAEALRASRAVSEDEADRRSDALAVQAARVEAARAGIALTETLLDRLVVRAPFDGTILQVNTRTGEYVAPAAGTPPLVIGRIEEVQVRADVDEQLASRIAPGCSATGYLKGQPDQPISLEFVRIEPFVVPKRNLTGLSTERVDTRVLQVIFKFPRQPGQRIYVGQQMDLFIDEAKAAQP